METHVYRYHARTVEGHAVDGAMEAAGIDAVLTSLATRALYVTRIARADRPHPSLGRFLRAGHLRPADRSAMFRSFATLMRAGVSLRRSIDVVAHQTTHRTPREALRAVLADVEQGAAFSAALARRPHIFSALDVAMIRAGETGGTLDDVLERVALLVERDLALRKKLQAALAYPAIVLAAAAVLVAYLLCAIVPMFATMFAGFHVELPQTTRWLLDLSAAMRRPAVWFGAGAAASGVAVVATLVLRTDAARIRFEQFRFRLPVAGMLLRNTVAARTTRTLATLLRSGIELVTAIDTVIPVAGSLVYARALGDAAIALREGEPFTDALARSDIFDPMFLTLARVGEETGLLDEMLLKVAEYLERDIEAAVATLGALIEPGLIVVLGTIVGFIVFSIFLPLYSLIGSVAQ